MTIENPNATVTEGTPTPDLLDDIFARMTAARIAEHEARQHADEWPGHVNDVLLTLSAKVDALTMAVTALTAKA